MGSDRAKYRKYKKICAMIGVKESNMTEKIEALRENSRTGTIFHRNGRTNLSFYMHVDRASSSGSRMVRLYEDRPEGRKLIMSGEIRTKPPNKPGRQRAGMSTIVGTMMVIGIAAAVGTTFYLSLIENTKSELDAITVDVNDITIRALLDGTDVNTIHLDMIITVSQHMRVSIGGDVDDTDLFDGNTPYDDDETPESEVVGQGNGVRITYSGFIGLTDPKAVGDNITILIDYGENTRTVDAEVRGI